MSNGGLLFWTAVFIAAAVTDTVYGRVFSATFEWIIGLGIGLNLLKKFLKEAE